VAVLVVLLAGCGADVGEPGDPQARRMLVFAGHGRAIENQVGAAGRALLVGHASARDTRLVLAKLVQRATLLHTDVTRTPLGVPGRVPTLEGAREVRSAAEFLHSYAEGHDDGLELAVAHLEAATRAFDGAAGALRPALTAVQEEALARLEAPTPAVR
jgi:hypothetical protein